MKAAPSQLTPSGGSDHRLVGRCASATMASAASSVIGFPFSRLWIVMRETPRSLATSVGVPMASLIALYSVAVMLAKAAGASDLGGEFSGDGATGFGSRPVRTEAILPDESHLIHLPFWKRVQAFVKFANWIRLEEPDSATGLDFGGKSGAGGVAGGSGFGLVGRHGLGWFGVGRSQWRREERKIDLRAPQELYVKYFYTPFRPANAQAVAPATLDSASPDDVVAG